MIYIVSRGVPSKRYPLNGIFEMDQAKALQHHGQRILFVGLDFRSFKRKRKFGIYYTVDNGIHCAHISFPLGNLEHPLFNLLARKITRFGAGIIFKKWGHPVIIHAHFSQIGSLAAEIKKLCSAPLIITEHNSSLNTDKISPYLYAVSKAAYGYADMVISVSKSLCNSLATRFNVKAIVVPNIVDDLVFNSPILTASISEPEMFTYVSVGALDFRKGFDLLIDAFSKAEFNKNVTLKIIGDGELRESLTKEAYLKGVGDKIHFLGFQSREKIVELFQTANAFVLPSRRETFGLVYVEALFTGLPVIATPCGGPEEFITPENGILVPIEDVSMLSNAMSSMVDNYSKYDPLDISKKAMSLFSPQIIAAKLTALYNTILEERK